MNPQRFEQITGAYGRLRMAVVGDFCLDRYLHIDPAREEISLETGKPADQVVQVRPQPGGAGTVLANAAALAPAHLRAVGFCGWDGEGYELVRGLRKLGAELDLFVRTRRRMTFTYTKPLVVRPGRPPEELSRLDIRDRTPTPQGLVEQMLANLRAAADQADVVILLEQATDTRHGVLCPPVKRAAAELAAAAPQKVFIADSRCDPGGYAAVHIKVNRQEVRRHFESAAGELGVLAARWSAQTGRCVFVTLGAGGMLAAEPSGATHRVEAIPVRGPIDVVGAGDAVLVHLGMALAAGASVAEAMALANAAGSVVVRKIGTTGTATIPEVAKALGLAP